MPAEIEHNRRAGDRYQDQLDTRALEVANRAIATAEQAIVIGRENFGLLREDLKAMRDERRQNHESAEKQFASINRAQWTAAIGLIGLLLGWVGYLVIHNVMRAP